MRPLKLRLWVLWSHWMLARLTTYLSSCLLSVKNVRFLSFHGVRRRRLRNKTTYYYASISGTSAYLAAASEMRSSTADAAAVAAAAVCRRQILEITVWRLGMHLPVSSPFLPFPFFILSPPHPFFLGFMYIICPRSSIN